MLLSNKTRVAIELREAVNRTEKFTPVVHNVVGVHVTVEKTAHLTFITVNDDSPKLAGVCWWSLVDRIAFLADRISA